MRRGGFLGSDLDVLAAVDRLRAVDVSSPAGLAVGGGGPGADGSAPCAAPLVLTSAVEASPAGDAPAALKETLAVPRCAATARGAWLFASSAAAP